MYMFPYSSGVTDKALSSSNRSQPFSAARPELPSEHPPTGWLPRVLRPRDLTILCLFAVLLINNVQTVAGGGPSSFLYWSLGFLLFLIPSALICAQLYRLFPGEGAVYLWANKAFGSFWDTFLGFFCNWWPGAIGLTVEAEAVVSSIQGINGNWLSAPWEQGVVAVLALILAQALCYLGQRSLQRILNTAFYAYASMFALVGLAGLIWIIGGHPLQSDFSARAWQLNPSNYPIFATVTVALLGMAIPLNLGAEVTDERQGHKYLLWSTLIIIVAYLFVTLAALAVLSPNDLKNPAFIGVLFQHVFGPALGTTLTVIYYLILAVYFVCATAAFNAMFSRLLLVSSMDRRLPGAMRRLNKNRVPFNAMLVQTVLNAIFIIILFFIAPSSSNPELSLTVFLVVLNGASTVWNIAMIGLFLCGIFLFIRYSAQLARRWIVPPLVLHLAAAFGIVVACVSIYSTFFVGSPVPDVLNNQDWVFWVLLIVLASLTIGAVYSFLVPEAEDLAELTQSKPAASPSANGGVPAPLAPQPAFPQSQIPFSQSISQPLRHPPQGPFPQPVQGPYSNPGGRPMR
jgi:amino acid transporter